MAFKSLGSFVAVDDLDACFFCLPGFFGSLAFLDLIFSGSGKWHVLLDFEQFLHMGLHSSHLILRSRQVKQPVLLRLLNARFLSFGGTDDNEETTDDDSDGGRDNDGIGGVCRNCCFVVRGCVCIWFWFTP